MRYSMNVGKQRSVIMKVMDATEAVKLALRATYNLHMLVLMYVEIGLLALLVVHELMR